MTMREFSITNRLALLDSTGIQNAFSVLSKNY